MNPSAQPAAAANTQSSGSARSYKDTLNLPRTPFPMKASLVQNEPTSMKRWQSMHLYERLRREKAGRPRFIFHDGPPYANANIHLGHLLNKTLKDFVVRSRTMMGYDCAYVPGWDCHGLPIEHRVMGDLVESGKVEKLKTLTVEQARMAVRRECQKHAEKHVRVQAAQMQRLLTLADYEHPYLTMSPEYEAGVLEVLAGLIEQGLVFRALKPVHWSIANETALADAELEYYDRDDPAVYVDFEAADGEAVYDAFGLPPHAEEDEEEEEPVENGDPAAPATATVPLKRPRQTPCFMIWTTTPWTLPANLGIAVHPRLDYALVKVDGNITVIAAGLVERVTKEGKAQSVTVLAKAPGSRLVGLRYRHPFAENLPPCGLGRKCDPQKAWSVVAAEYVAAEDGTGLVHTAPGHGEEDFQTGLREGLAVYCPVRGDGTYDETVPGWLQGQSIWKANELVLKSLRESGHLFHESVLRHSYPHDWRGKTPVIFRCTEQWFVGVDMPTKRDGRTLRAMALAAVGGQDDHAPTVAFVPEWGQNRMRGMLESRPDWCISRQRSWGLPIPCFYAPEGGVLMTAAVVRAVAKVVREKGSDAWFTLGASDLLKHYNATADPDAPAWARELGARDSGLGTLRKGPDILDVWFESGSSWHSVMRQRSNNADFPSDLYLEGSDQHRGWFQTSLLPALGAMGAPPYRTVVTNGFIVDKDGRKMSKSIGNTMEVDDLLKDFGADVCRWWVASLAFENDVKADRSFFDTAGESYRKVRNTIRFMLSNLFDFTPTGGEEFPPTSLDAWVLSEYDRLAGGVIGAYERFDFREAHTRLFDFCNETLSATYLSAVKDRLYCDAPDSPRRRRTQAALWRLTDGLCRLLAPIMPHTADEAFRALWGATPDDTTRCVHAEEFVRGPGVAADAGWATVMEALDPARCALEQAKTELGLKDPLDAGVVLPDADGALTRFDPIDLADLLGVSRVIVHHGANSLQIMDLRDQPQCERSWKRDGTVRPRCDGAMLSERDAAAVGV